MRKDRRYSDDVIAPVDVVGFLKLLLIVLYYVKMKFFSKVINQYDKLGCNLLKILLKLRFSIKFARKLSYFHKIGSVSLICLLK